MLLVKRHPDLLYFADKALLYVITWPTHNERDEIREAGVGDFDAYQHKIEEDINEMAESLDKLFTATFTFSLQNQALQ